MCRANILDLGSLRRHFQHFDVTFEQNIKVSNHIVNSVSHHILKKYLGPNEIILTFSIRPIITCLLNNNEEFLRVTNHTGQVERNLLGPAGIRTRDLRFTSPMLYQLSYRSSWELVVK